MKTHYGCKFFRYDDNNTLEVLRVIRMKNETTFIMRNDKGETFKMTEKDLQERYVKLNPDAYISISVVELRDGNKDVVITLHRKQELKEGDSSPYVICRQCIYDFFTNQIVKVEGIQYVGISISRDTCPPDIDFNTCAICDKIVSTQMIDVYLDDKFDDIIELINTKRADMVLADLVKKAPFNIRGYETNVKDLMINTRFMYDFLKAFDIYPLNFKITLEPGNVIPKEQINSIEDIIKYSISAVCVLPYAKDVDLSKIQQNYILVSDTEGDIYIVAFIKGNYINRPYEELDDHRDRDMLISMVKNRHV